MLAGESIRLTGSTCIKGKWRVCKIKLINALASVYKSQNRVKISIAKEIQHKQMSVN